MDGGRLKVDGEVQCSRCPHHATTKLHHPDPRNKPELGSAFHGHQASHLQVPAGLCTMQASPCQGSYSTLYTSLPSSLPCFLRTILTPRQCDEENLPCHNCVRRCLPCSYAPPSRFASLSSAREDSHQRHASPAASSVTASSATATTPLPASADSNSNNHTPSQHSQSSQNGDHHATQSGLSRTEELALMHFYTTATSSSLASDEADKLVWRDVVPLDGFTFDFVLDAILALAAIHKATVQPTSAAKYSAASAFYQHRGLRAFNQQLSQRDASSSHAFFAFSMTLTVHTIATARGGPGLLPTSPFETLSSVFELLGGTGHLSKAVVAPQSSSRYRDLIKGNRIFEASQNPQPLPGDVSDALRALRQHVAHIVPSAHSEQSHSYHATIERLEATFRIVNQSPELAMGAIVAWPVQMDEQSFSLYRQADPLMLLIFIHYGVLYLTLNGRWWAQGFGGRIIRSLSDYLHNVDTAWSRSTAWALAKAAGTFPS